MARRPACGRRGPVSSLSAAAFALATCLLAASQRVAFAARPPLHGAGGAGCGGLPPRAVTGSAFKDAGGAWRFESGVRPGAAAHAAYLDASATPSNFGKLRVATSPAHADGDQAFAAGFLEGYLTAPRIADHHHNLKTYFITTLNASLEKPMSWIHRQDKWVRERALGSCFGGRGPAEEAAAAGGGGGGSGGGGGGGALPGGEAGADAGPDAAAGAAANGAYWTAVGLMLTQASRRFWDGLVEGYAARARAEAAGGGGLDPLARDDLLFLHSNGDLYDIIDMYEAQAASAAGRRVMPRSARAGSKAFDQMGPLELAQAFELAGKCSALVKVKEDLSEIFFGHSTWDNYMAMQRIFKHYELNFNLPGVAAKKLSFSSYPVFKALTPRSVLSWQRVRTAHLLASSGAQWVEIFARRNSGTYNNQYLVTDLNRFSPGKYLLPGAFHVVEQLHASIKRMQHASINALQQRGGSGGPSNLPGMIESADLTDVLARGYWPSYNVAYFPRIYKASGYPDVINDTCRRGKPYEQPAGWLKYQAGGFLGQGLTSPRANIFRRDQSTVRDLPSLKHLMRYNDWRRDPLSEGSPFASVCARGDLAPEGAEYGPILKGCYDTKVTTASMALELRAEVVSGPTAQGQPPFEWSGPWANVEHRGMPNRFDFSFEPQSPADLPLEPGCGVDNGEMDLGAFVAHS
ncbi:hypothetical protein Rsub_08872 [Raphidocelis subcapitata]|uniref:Phospholipase B-like n=1 Tax=Raphidocelis subcapitata TaxID=307507 RepID=A0A2V0P8D5_9CHLO|nr:hypothetical protein Rsub_08872 [Raphidocelis subcapitata]|eukprot:GBF96124.1 hypothetical protein Rsub_08872 [Raphidocelis subcapitata]